VLGRCPLLAENSFPFSAIELRAGRRIVVARHGPGADGFVQADIGDTDTKP